MKEWSDLMGSTINKKQSTICAGIVTFNPNIQEIEENIKNLARQVEKIYIVDNCSKNTKFISCISQYCTVIRNSENKGLAVALNQLVQHAQQDKYTHILLFDQDSTITDGYVTSLTSCIHQNVAIVCPIIQDKNKPDRTISAQGIINISRPITSGGLYDISIWKKLSGFNEDFFIELIDYEYDERCIQSKYSILQQSEAILLQEGGHATKTHLPSGIVRKNGKIKLKFAYRYNYSPARYFHRYRNYIIFLSIVNKKRVSEDKKMFIKSLVHDLLIEKHHIQALKNITKGIYAGQKYLHEKKTRS